jgi:hypothetical protein
MTIPRLSGSKVSTEIDHSNFKTDKQDNTAKTKPSCACFFPQAGFLLRLLLDPEDGGDVLPKYVVTFTEIHVVIFRKTEHFVATAVRSSDPSLCSFYFVI